MLLEVQVFGSEPPCIYCKRTEQAARKAAAKFAPGEVNVTKWATDSAEAAWAGFTSTPAVVVNGKLVSQGRVPEADELEAIFRAELGG